MSEGQPTPPKALEMSNAESTDTKAAEVKEVFHEEGSVLLDLSDIPKAADELKQYLAELPTYADFKTVRVGTTLVITKTTESQPQHIDIFRKIPGDGKSLDPATTHGATGLRVSNVIALNGDYRSNFGGNLNIENTTSTPLEQLTDEQRHALEQRQAAATASASTTIEYMRKLIDTINATIQEENKKLIFKVL